MTKYDTPPRDIVKHITQKLDRLETRVARGENAYASSVSVYTTGRVPSTLIPGQTYVTSRYMNFVDENSVVRPVGGFAAIGVGAVGLEAANGTAPRLDLQTPLTGTTGQAILSGPDGISSISFGVGVGGSSYGTFIGQNVTIADAINWKRIATGNASSIWMGNGEVWLEVFPSGTAGTVLPGPGSGEHHAILRNDGKFEVDSSIWIAGTARLYSAASNNLSTNGAFTAEGPYLECTGGDIWARSGLAAQTSIGARGPSGEAAIEFGIAGDTKIWREFAGGLLTNSAISTQQYIIATGNMAAQWGLAGQVWSGAVGPSSEAAIKFGSAGDTYIYRSAASTLKLNGTFSTGASIFADDVVAVNQGDHTPSGGSGKIFFGSAWDTNIYRSTTNTLKTDGNFFVGLVLYFGNTDSYISRVGTSWIRTDARFEGNENIRSNRYFTLGSPANEPATNVDKAILFTNVASGGGPSNSPTGGHWLWAEAGALKGKGSSGTVTTIAAAEPHCPECGNDFVLEWKNDESGRHLVVCLWCLSESGIPGIVTREEVQ